MDGVDSNRNTWFAISSGQERIDCERVSRESNDGAFIDPTVQHLDINRLRVRSYISQLV